MASPPGTGANSGTPRRFLPEPFSRNPLRRQALRWRQLGCGIFLLTSRKARDIRHAQPWNSVMKAHNNRGRVLVVDDQPANLRVVSALLERQGYEVAIAEDGEAALAQAEERAPDLMLLDMMMPGMDGFGVMEEIRLRALLPRVPVVFLTAAQDRALLLRAFEVGAVDYVVKPFIPEELLARVNAHVGLKLARDRLEHVARERQELVNLVAHDLKNPLSSVVFASDILVSGTLKPERIPRYLEVIRESAEDGLNYIRRYLETQATARNVAATGDARVALAAIVEWIVGRYGLQFE